MKKNYYKLRKEKHEKIIQELQRKLNILIFYPDSQEAFHIITTQKHIRLMDEEIMKGTGICRQ